MENDILELLVDVCYTGPLLDAQRLSQALSDGPKSSDFMELVAWLAQQLKDFHSLEEHVSSDQDVFLMELSSLLKELCCPYAVLMEGPASQRFQDHGSCCKLLNFLISELQAARMTEADKPDPASSLKVQVIESSTAGDLKTILLAMRLSKPPDNISATMLFSKIEEKVQELMARAPPGLLGKPLFSGVLSPSQWQTVASLQAELQQEYRMRRQMLLQRQDVTIQSFQWSDRAKKQQDHISELYRKHRHSMIEDPKVSLSDLLFAREDLAVLEKTSGSAVRKNTQCAVNRVLIGQVPDRGGRTDEQQAPPPEMPSWQQRSAGPPGGGGGGGWRGGGGRGRGGDGGGGGGGQQRGRGGGGWGGKNEGRVQGGWQQGGRGGAPYQQQEGGYQGGRGGYQGGGGEYQGRGGGYQGGGGEYQGRGGGYQGGGGEYQGRGGGYQGRGRGGGYRGNRGGRGRDNNY